MTELTNSFTHVFYLNFARYLLPTPYLFPLRHLRHLAGDVHPGHPVHGLREAGHDPQHLVGQLVGTDLRVPGGDHRDLLSVQ